MSIAIIPARGGSKRIPRKNIKTFNGKPIISYTIETALRSDLFDNVIVSTDDDEIAEYSISLGAKVPFMRPENLSDDFSTTGQVVSHAVEELGNRGIASEYVCCIYATAPFIKDAYLKRAYDMLVSSGKSYVFTVTRSPFSIERGLFLNEQGSISPYMDEHQFTRTQDLREAYYDAGQFYWGKSSSFSNNKPVYTEDSLPLILPRYLAHDIDTEEDWDIAEIMYKAIYNSK